MHIHAFVGESYNIIAMDQAAVNLRNIM